MKNDSRFVQILREKNTEIVVNNGGNNPDVECIVSLERRASMSGQMLRAGGK